MSDATLLAQLQALVPLDCGDAFPCDIDALLMPLEDVDIQERRP